MRGRLKVYLGYAAGVGKTWRMLHDAQELRSRGVDVVVGYFEPHGRPDTIAKSEGLEFVPRRTAVYRGATFEEMDADAILRRRPAVCVVDELAHTNVPGSERAKRWQDVEVLLEAGIDVLTTVNVQHLESLNDQVSDVTGIRARETVPDWVMDSAAEVVMVDLTPEALRNRLARGVVYPAGKARQAMEHFFTESNLTALREMALRHAAHELEERLSGFAPAASSTPPETAARRECILICLTGRPSAAILIRRGKRVADYLQAGCLALHVAAPGRRNAADTEAVQKHLGFARNLRIDTHVIESAGVARAILDFARRHAVTQIFVGRSLPAPWYAPLHRNTVSSLVRLARDMEITIVAEHRH